MIFLPGGCSSATGVCAGTTTIGTSSCVCSSTTATMKVSGFLWYSYQMVLLRPRESRQARQQSEILHAQESALPIDPY